SFQVDIPPLTRLIQYSMTFYHSPGGDPGNAFIDDNSLVVTEGAAAAPTNGIGTALLFNGTNSYVSIATTGSLTGTFTVELWVNPNHPTDPLPLVASCCSNQFGFDLKLKQGNLI